MKNAHKYGQRTRPPVKKGIKRTRSICHLAMKLIPSLTHLGPDWYTGSPVHKYTGTSVHRCTGTYVHRYTGIPVYWHTDTPGHQYTGTPKRRHNGTLEHRGTGILTPWYTSTLVYQYTGTPVQKHTGTPPNLTGTVSRPIQPGRSAHKIRGHGKLRIGQYPLTDRIHGGKGWNSRRIATPTFATESTWLIQTLLWPTR